MEAKVLYTIMKYGLIKEKDNIVVGVSGGPDSMALLYLLIEAKKQIDFNLIIAHVNHGVRGNEALEDELFVQRKAKELGIPFYSKTTDMIAYGKEKGISSEEAGRELRYGFFREILDKYGGGKIAVAHNMNDQAETLLMRIMRGTGIDGLGGMEFITHDIIRPILNISRNKIEKYIEERNIETVLDKTNLLPIYTRNKIRLELIPYIEDNFNPSIIESLWRLSQISSIDSKFLEEYSDKKYNLILKSEMENYIILDKELFRRQDISIQQRIIRKSTEKLRGKLQGLTEQHISSVVDLFNFGDTGKTINLPDGIIAKTDYNNLIIEKGKIDVPKEYSYKLDIGNNYFPSVGYNFNIKVLPREEIQDIKSNKNLRFFDYDEVKGNLVLRNRRNGDRFIPYGMNGSKKLKDYFIDEKISRDLRDKIPVIADSEHILWVVGYRTSNLYMVKNNTKRVLVIQYFDSNNREE